MARVLAIAALLVLVAVDAGCQAPPRSVPSSNAQSPRVLVFSRTAGFRHDSIEAGHAMFRDLHAAGDLIAELTESSERFSQASLESFDVVVFLNTTGDVLDDEQQIALQRFVERGGGFVGIHAATDTEYDWPWYGSMIGAYFAGHPHVQPALVRVEDHAHPATAGLPATWTHVDEWYDFDRNPRDGGHRVLMTVDEASYEGGAMGDDHPIAWCREVARGRSFYTALGHTPECFADPMFQAHIRGAIEWAAIARSHQATPQGDKPPRETNFGRSTCDY